MRIITQSADGEREVDLLAAVQALWKRLWLLVLAAVLCGGLALGGAILFLTPRYTADIDLYVVNYAESSGIVITSSDLNASAALVDTYTVILSSDSFLEMVADALGDEEITARALKGMVSAAAVDNTEVLQVSVEDTSAERAAEIANLFADLLPGELERIVSGSSVKIIDRARIPEESSSVSRVEIALAGGCVGFLLAAGAVLLREGLDRRVQSEADLEEYGLPVLGVIPELSSAGRAHRRNG